MDLPDPFIAVRVGSLLVDRGELSQTDLMRAEQVAEASRDNIHRVLVSLGARK